MLPPLLFAITTCAIAVAGEAAFMGRGGNAYMKSLRQPPIAPPQWAWPLIGFAYYVICCVIAYRLSSQSPVRLIPVALLLVVMAANTFWNYIYFRRRDLRVVFWYSVAYSIIVVVLLCFLFSADRIAAITLLLYAAYLPYALVLFHRLWKLNAESAGHRR